MTMDTTTGTTTGTAGRQLAFGEDAHERIRRGIDALARAVEVTLGPRGRTVIIESDGGPPRIVNSGVSVARAVELDDPFENLGARLLREVASRTSERAGDGTTTATVLAHGMVDEGLRFLAAGMNPMEVKRGIDQAVETVVAALHALARPCERSDDVARVATLSANGDRAIGDLVARAIERVGRDGAVTVEDGSGMQCELELVEGAQFDRGLLSAFFVTDLERQACLLEDVSVLLCDRRLAAVQDVVAVLEAAAPAGRPLLVIAEDLDTDALATLVVNHVRGVVRACAVKAPGFGDARRAMLEDLAAVTHAKVVSAESGTDLAKLPPDVFGHARRIEVDSHRTTIVGGAGRPEDVRQRVAALKAERERTREEPARRALDERIARLSGGVAVIRVGAATETEQKERRLRVEDALHATRAAMDEGVVPGGGVALVRVRAALAPVRVPSLDQDAGLRIVERALERPLRRIVANAGDDPSPVLHRVEDATQAAFGYDASTREFGDLEARGVIDPAKVTRLALQNAASIAGLVLSTDCLVATGHAPEGAGALAAALGGGPLP